MTQGHVMIMDKLGLDATEVVMYPTILHFGLRSDKFDDINSTRVPELHHRDTGSISQEVDIRQGESRRGGDDR